MSALTSTASVCALVPHHDCLQWLSGAIESLLSQTRPPDAVVVLDDASAESPARLGVDYPDVTFLRASENVGPYRLVQTALDSTTFDAYLFQDADDVSHPDRLATLLAVGEANDADIVGSHETELDVLAPEARPRDYPLDVNAALADNPIAFALLHPTSLVSRAAVRRVHGYAGLRFSADVDFLWRAGHVCRIVNADRHLYLRRRHPRSLTGAAETGTRSAARRQLEGELREGARSNARRASSGRPPDLSPFVPAPPVALELLSGPPLGTTGRRASPSIAGPRRTGPVLIVGGPRNGGDVLASALDLHPSFAGGTSTRPVLAGPEVTEQAFQLAEAHSDAKIVVVDRDVETTVASLAVRPDAHENFYSESSARAAAVRLGEICDFLALALGPDRVMRLGLRQLVERPVDSLRSCLAFLGEPMVAHAALPLAGLRASCGAAAPSTSRPGAVEVRRRPGPERPGGAGTLAARLQRMVRGAVDAHATVAVVSRGDASLLDLAPARAWHFPATADGTFAGEYPATGEHAVALLDAARDRGATHLLVPAPAGWWLSYYDALRDHLEGTARRLASLEETGTLYDLVAVREEVRA